MRVYKRKNDIYEVELPDCKRYFQFLQSDSYLLGGNVIAIFKNRYDKSESPDVNDIVKGPVEYFCHTDVNYGVKLGLWKKYGNAPACNDLSKIYFRYYADAKIVDGKIVKRWFIWKINENPLHFVKLPYRFRKAYPSRLFTPQSVYNKIRYGEFPCEKALGKYF